MQFLVEAWANTVHYFAETMRMQKRTASEIIGSLNSWGHWWKYTASSSDGGNGAAAPRSEPDNRELRTQIDSMKGQIKHWRAEASKFRDEFKILRSGGERDRDDETPRRKQGGGQQPQQGPPRKVQKGGGKGGQIGNFGRKRGGR